LSPEPERACEWKEDGGRETPEGVTSVVEVADMERGAGEGANGEFALAEEDTPLPVKLTGGAALIVVSLMREKSEEGEVGGRRGLLENGARRFVTRFVTI
jgi:hypothetical protein